MEEEDGGDASVAESIIDIDDDDGSGSGSGSGLADMAESIMETVGDIVNATQVILSLFYAIPGVNLWFRDIMKCCIELILLNYHIIWDLHV